MYSQYREQTLQLASQAKLQHKAVLHSLKGPHGEDLFTDYFYTNNNKSSKTVVHFSGLHGVEGYLGSLVQQQILTKLSQMNELPFQLVMVHSINPYGMAWYRRTNAKNVDLNRNSLKIHDIPNDSFERFSPFLDTNADRKSLEDLFGFFVGLYTIGFKRTAQSIACGQTDFPMSVFFAGQKLQPELESLRDNLKSLIPKNSHLYIVDVHTGLGSFGEESLIVENTEAEEDILFFEKNFHKKATVPGRSFASYQAHGTIVNLFKDDWKAENIRYVCEEFGTKPFYKVLKALMKDNYLHNWQPDLTNEEKHRAWTQVSKEMLSAFFPETPAWREKCIATGLLRFEQLVQTLK